MKKKVGLTLSKWEAFLWEFPWLRHYVKRKPSRAKVELLDLDFYRRSIRWSWSRFLVLDSCGKLIAEVGQFGRDRGYQPVWLCFSERSRKIPRVCWTVEQVMDHLSSQQVNDACFVLELSWYLSGIWGDFPVRQVVIHKGHKGQNLGVAIDNDLSQALSELKKEIEVLG